MSQHHREPSNKRVSQPSPEIFRFPTREERQRAKEQDQAKVQQKSKPAVNYKDEDLSGCLSGSLSESLDRQKKPTEQSETVVANYKDEDLSGCLSGWLNSPAAQPKPSERDRYAPTHRNVKTGEITPIERDDLSGAITPPDEEKSGWLYFN